MSEKVEKRGEAARKMRFVLKALAKAYPDADCALQVRNPYEVLIATILSAQCTDANVNRVTPGLFRRYPDARALAGAKIADVEARIRTLGLFRNKARHIVAAAQHLCAMWNGEIPDAMNALLALPGVGRKTANCVLVNAFGKPGIMCDTHCCRLARRIGLTAAADPGKIERDLAALMPPKAWGAFSHRIIRHGREVCHARTPRCGECVLRRVCDAGRASSPGVHG